MAKPLSKTVVVAYGRSAVAKSGKKGALRNLHPIDMGGLVLKGVMEKIPQLDPNLVEDVILGCAIPEAKQGLNPARLVAARAGLPYTACGLTVDRFCSSSLQAVALAAWQIEAGQADCIVAGGIESMTALPMTLDRSGDRDPWLVEHDPSVYLGWTPVGRSRAVGRSSVLMKVVAMSAILDDDSVSDELLDYCLYTQLAYVNQGFSPMGTCRGTEYDRALSRFPNRAGMEYELRRIGMRI